MTLSKEAATLAPNANQHPALGTRLQPADAKFCEGDRSRQASSPPSPYNPRPTAPCCLATRAQPKLKGGGECLPYGKQLIKLGHFILGKRRQKSATWYGTEKGKQGIAAHSLLKSDGRNSKLNRQKGTLLQTKGDAYATRLIFFSKEPSSLWVLQVHEGSERN